MPVMNGLGFNRWAALFTGSMMTACGGAPADPSAWPGKSEQNLREFINLQSDCPPNCPPGADVCCYYADPIVVEG